MAIGGHKPPDITPGQNPCRIRTQCTMSFYVTEKGVLSGGLRPPILKFSFLGDVWFCGFYPALPLNGGLGELCPRGLCPVTREGTVAMIFLCPCYRRQPRRHAPVGPTEATVLTTCILSGPGKNNSSVTNRDRGQCVNDNRRMWTWTS